LSERLAVTAEWITFFHTDAYHRVRSIRFRKADSLVKRFQSYTPFSGSSGQGGTGLFGHSLFRPYESENKKSLNRLMICEGEINLLQVHSLAVRTAQAVEGPSGPCYANWLAATGSSTTVDVTTISNLLASAEAEGPLVVIQDNDEAGDHMVEQMLCRFTLEVVVPPVRGQDIDDFIGEQTAVVHHQYPGQLCHRSFRGHHRAYPSFQSRRRGRPPFVASGETFLPKDST
jgi:hypothetical protein